MVVGSVPDAPGRVVIDSDDLALRTQIGVTDDTASGSSLDRMRVFFAPSSSISRTLSAVTGGRVSS